uniref:Uncharacterized protein n=1 Tax=Tanacetum cinerariifolium TaxID=118510 RepID=A0A699I561_TANCI|nr:hypothetical protein [Tanacetum cinerariifolium]
MSTPVLADPESSTQADGAQSSRVPVPLPKDPYEAIKQAYLVGTDTESEPFEDPESETPESPHIVAPPTCHVEESESSGTFGARSTSSDSTAPLSPDHPLTQTTPVLVPILRRTPGVAVPVSHVMSPGLSKSYRGTSELILGTDSEEIDESSDSDSESKDAEDEDPTTEDGDPAAGDEGLAVGVEDPGVDDESYGLDEETHGVDDESHGLDNKGRNIKSDGLGLGEEEVVPEGQQQAALVVGTTVSMPLGLRVPVLHPSPGDQRGCRHLSRPHSPHGQTRRMTLGSLPISPSLSIKPSLVSSPMIPLTVPSPIASTMATSRATIPVDEDQFIESFVEARAGIRGMVGRVDTQMTDMSRAGYDDHRLVHDMLLQQTALQRELQEMRDRVTALEQERDRKERLPKMVEPDVFDQVRFTWGF